MSKKQTKRKSYICIRIKEEIQIIVKQYVHQIAKEEEDKRCHLLIVERGGGKEKETYPIHPEVCGVCGAIGQIHKCRSKQH
jgi:NAD-dependent dihydropyrimidine dehydrogenase PreA subunit